VVAVVPPLLVDDPDPDPMEVEEVDREVDVKD